MLSIPDPGNGGASADYYLNYYNLECIEAAEWFGGAAEIFGLAGEVDHVSFSNLMAGRSPDGGINLVKNAGNPDRDSHWDLTFSAPKPVSVLYALGSEEVRRQIVEAHKSAVKVALAYMEEHAAITRSGKGGTIREHCLTVGCCFTHDSSREHDMQLHSHAVVLNAGIRADGSTGALHSIELFRHKFAMGAAYQAEMAHQLTERLHVVIELEKVGFHIQGVPRELCRENSTRRQQIEAVLKEEGLEGAAASKKVAEDTRAKKQPMEKAAKFEKWHQTCENFGWGQKEAAQLIEDARRQAHDSKQQGPKQSAAEGKKAEQQRPEEKRAGQSESKDQKTQEAKSQEQKKKEQAGRKESNAKRDAERRTVKLEKKKIKLFTRDLRKAIDRIYVENQTVPRVMKVANRLAAVHGVKTETVMKAVKDAKLPKHLGWARVEYRKLFPKARAWNPLHNVKQATLVFRDKPRKWGKIEKKVVIAKFLFHQHEIRIQQKHLVPGAPKWSPLQKLTLPALRLVAKRAPFSPKLKLKNNNNAHEHRHER